MKISSKKCETIIFRPPVSKCNNNVKRNWKYNNNSIIPNKDTVEYLGIHPDKFLSYNIHINLQIIKARNGILCV